MYNMRVQLSFIALASLVAMFAVPFFNSHRMNGWIFAAAVLTFAGIPLLAAKSQRTMHRPVILVAIGFLLLCPLVYLLTDPLDARFEKLRDGLFLATGSTLIFVCSVWFRSSLPSGKLLPIFVAAIGLLSAIAGIFVLLWMTMYFE